MKDSVLHIVIDRFPESSVSFLDWLTGLTVPLLALLGIYIAYQQYQINKQRLRHETYERRLQVYKTVQRYLSEVLRAGKVTYEQALNFKSDAAEAAFLFEASVQIKIDEIYSKSIDLAAVYDQIYPFDGSDGLPVGEERTSVIAEKSELIEWHLNELKTSREFFAKKLGLNDI